MAESCFRSCDIGLALYPNDGMDAETLLTQADIAMYSAKKSGRNCFRFYAPQMNEWAARRLRLEGDLRRALDRQEFVLHYQPQVGCELWARRRRGSADPLASP